MESKLFHKVFSGNFPFAFTIIYHSNNYIRRVINAIIGHEHYWIVREDNNEVISEYRHVVLMCNCGEFIRVFVPPIRLFEGLEKLVNTGYKS